MARVWTATGIATLLLLEGCRRAGAVRPTLPMLQDWGQVAAVVVFLIVLGLIIRWILLS
jgi:hypothetical protein